MIGKLENMLVKIAYLSAPSTGKDMLDIFGKHIVRQYLFCFFVTQFGTMAEVSMNQFYCVRLEQIPGDLLTSAGSIDLAPVRDSPEFFRVQEKVKAKSKK